MIPAAGSAYAFTYTALGEAAAWIIGWNLLLEYVFAGSYVAVGWSGYLVSLLSQWGVPLPALLTSAPFAIGPHGLTATGSLINGPAFLFAAAMALIALRGVRLSSIVNAIIVALKVGALLLVVGFGSLHIHPRNWTPFMPANEGFGRYGWSGVLRAAAVVFVSYLGFDAIATLAQDTRNPQRNVPIGILGSLGAVSLLYIAVSLVLTGLVSYQMLDSASPLSVALRGGGPALTWLLPIVDLAAVIGLGSVVLIVMLAQPRVLHGDEPRRIGPAGLCSSASAFPHASLGHVDLRFVGGSVGRPISALHPGAAGIRRHLDRIHGGGGFCPRCCAGPIRTGTEPFRTPFVPVVPIAGFLDLRLSLDRHTFAHLGGLRHLDNAGNFHLPGLWRALSGSLT